MFANLKVRTKLIILTAVAAVSMCVMGIMNMNSMEESYQQSISSMKQVLYDDYDAQIRGQVESVREIPRVHICFSFRNFHYYFIIF